MEAKRQDMSITVSVMDVEPMKLVLGVIQDMLEDPEIRTGYKLRLCCALNIEYAQTPDPIDPVFARGIMPATW